MTDISFIQEFANLLGGGILRQAKNGEAMSHIITYAYNVKCYIWTGHSYKAKHDIKLLLWIDDGTLNTRLHQIRHNQQWHTINEDCTTTELNDPKSTAKFITQVAKQIKQHLPTTTKATWKIRDIKCDIRSRLFGNRFRGISPIYTWNPKTGRTEILKPDRWRYICQTSQQYGRLLGGLESRD